MSAPEGENGGREALVRDATRLYLRLRENPDDPSVQDDIQAFVEQSDDARRAFERVSRATQAVRAGARAKSRKTYSFVLLGALAVGLALGFNPLRVAVLADFQTDYAGANVTLASGDRAVLDAGSAIIDDSSASQRRITLLAGSGFFDVDQDGRRFVVSSGDLEIEALGTRFEVSQLEDAVLVAVEEGIVEIRRHGQTWQAAEGQRLFWRGSASEEIVEVDLETVASWRSDQLDLTDMTFGAVVDVIDRRLPGRIVLAHPSLSDVELSGGLDISDPMAALETLVSAQNARILVSTRLGTVVVK